jgi:N-acetylmuramic acid 6-phosphate etherase
MLREDARIPRCTASGTAQAAAALNMIVRSIRNGGRLFYVGAGTSGRLGVLDASECPPTFGTASDLVQAIIAGGQRAVWESVEGAEDDFWAGADAIQLAASDGERPGDWDRGQAAAPRLFGEHSGNPDGAGPEPYSFVSIRDWRSLMATDRTW